MNVEMRRNVKAFAEQLELAISLAVKAHMGQRQKDGTPYILHPLHLMLQQNEPKAQIVAILHDVVEDTGVSFAELEQLSLSADILTAIRLLTHEASVPYFQYIRQIKPNALARQVKLADLQHNMDSRRLPSLRPKDMERLLKYHEAWRILTE